MNQNNLKTLIYFADLTHTAQGISSKTFPLGVGCVAAYAQQELRDDIELDLFKFPEDLNSALLSKKPGILAMSNFSWNLQLTYTFALHAKELYPDLIVVLGGPNFPISVDEQLDFLKRYSAVDFYIFGEGEEGFVNLFKNLKKKGMDAQKLKKETAKIPNCHYLHDGKVVHGEDRRIQDLDQIPCPFASGLMDKFFPLPLIPILETTRGCPFSCTFCADGIDSKSRVFRYSSGRIDKSLEYIASKTRDCDELILADLNFGMYEFDLATSKTIARLRKEKGYPRTLKASAGKNKPERIIEVTKILKDSDFFVGAALQSTDPEVLSAIKRKNISGNKIMALADYGKKNSAAVTYAEVILGLPNDSKQAHYQSLRVGVDFGLNAIRMYQLMLLVGTEMADKETRNKYQMLIKWRIIPTCAGTYEIAGKKIGVGEFEEIVVGNSTLSFQDYLDCRLMNLIIEVFINNALFEEIFGLIHALGLSRFDFLLYIKENPKLYPEKTRAIFESFLKDTQDDLFETREEIETFIKDPKNVELHVRGKRGRNELLYHKALCCIDFKETHKLAYLAIKGFLKKHGLFNEKIKDYLAELERFSLLRKDQFNKTDVEYRESFKYDLKSIETKNFEINPNELEPNQTYSVKFCHDQDQVLVINRAIHLYGASLPGLARMIQRSNLKSMFRKFEQTVTLNSSS